MEELEKAHIDYFKRKAEIVSKLQSIRDRSLLQWQERQWVEQAIEFLSEREI